MSQRSNFLDQLQTIFESNATAEAFYSKWILTLSTLNPKTITTLTSTQLKELLTDAKQANLDPSTLTSIRIMINHQLSILNPPKITSTRTKLAFKVKPTQTIIAATKNAQIKSANKTTAPKLVKKT